MGSGFASIGVDDSMAEAGKGASKLHSKPKVASREIENLNFGVAALLARINDIPIIKRALAES